jgi:tetrahydromethanopterin S-methyltransferase subunit G
MAHRDKVDEMTLKELAVEKVETSLDDLQRQLEYLNAGS